METGETTPKDLIREGANTAMPSRATTDWRQREGANTISITTGGTGATTSCTPADRMTIISAALVDGKIEIVRRYSSKGYCIPSPIDRIEKEIYGTFMDCVVLVKTIKGKIIPGYSVDEHIEFEE